MPRLPEARSDRDVLPFARRPVLRPRRMVALPDPGERGTVPIALLAGLSAARHSSAALATAAEGWRRLATASGLAERLLQMQHEAAETLRRIEFILAQLRQSPRSQPSWLSDFDLSFPKDDAPVPQDDCALAALAHWALGRMATRLSALHHLAHDCQEYQAAHLLRLSVDEQRCLARSLVGFLHQPKLAATA